MISMKTCKKRLMFLWFAYGGVLFFILFFQSLFGHYGKNWSDAGGWFAITVLPTLTLMISVRVTDERGDEKQARKADRTFYRLSYGISVAYLTIILILLVIHPFIDFNAFELMDKSNIFVAMSQGLTSASLGYFFTKSASESDHAQRNNVVLTND